VSILDAPHQRVKDETRFSGSEVSFNSLLPRVLLLLYHIVSNLKDDSEGKLVLNVQVRYSYSVL
jgi:hypothetical protein